MEKIKAEFIATQIGLCHPATDSNNLFVLTEAEKAVLREAFSPIAYDGGGGQSYITEVRQTAYAAFPARIIEALHFQKHSIDPTIRPSTTYQ
jgi:hypothetical protein